MATSKKNFSSLKGTWVGCFLTLCVLAGAPGPAEGQYDVIVSYPALQSLLDDAYRAFDQHAIADAYALFTVVNYLYSRMPNRDPQYSEQLSVTQNSLRNEVMYAWTERDSLRQQLERSAPGGVGRGQYPVQTMPRIPAGRRLPPPR